MMKTIQMTFAVSRIVSSPSREGGKKFAELCGKWVNPAAYSHMFLGELQNNFFLKKLYVHEE